MKWTRRGLIYRPAGDVAWSRSHAAAPTVDVLPDRLRLYFSTRDDHNRSAVTFIDVDRDDPLRVIYRHDQPVLERGRLGTFDDSGVVATSLVTVDQRKYLFYIGFNAGTVPPYRLAIGLAVSDDGVRFERVSEAPIIDRHARDPIFATGACVRVENGRWRAWYLSATEWRQYGDRVEPVYNLREAESGNGIDWRRDGRVVVELRPGEGGMSRPSVLPWRGMYRMWYAMRGLEHYRTRRDEAYRMGYAESADGLAWTRRDDEVGIERSTEGWDSEMMAYPHVIELPGKLVMFYNGNGFGASGVGCMELYE